MNSLILIAAALAAEAPPPLPPEEETGDRIVVTAAREPVAAAASPEASASVRGDHGLGDELGLPTAADLVRLTPGVSVSVAGPSGSQTQIRIRGAEANHTLLFVDGIRFNDPAAGNEARFELLPSDGLDRIDVIRGPESALWGSEAIGGVVAAYTLGESSAPQLNARAEYGSLDSARVAAAGSLPFGKLHFAGTASWLASDGIDAIGLRGERDGFENRTASLKAVYAPRGLEIGAVGHWTEGKSEFDGFDPATFRRAETLDETRNRIAAGRLWVRRQSRDWTLQVEASLLGSVNRNRLGDDPLNRTYGDRFTLMGQASRQIDRHRFTLAIERQEEGFRARDQVYFGATDQDRSRNVTAFVGEWEAKWADWLVTTLSARHDDFSAFADATTLRAGVVLRPLPRWSVTAGYGEGIAQPTFYDLYGFFPGSFTGNPSLRPERSAEWHAGLRHAAGGLDMGVTAFRAKLEDEILDVFDPATFRSTTANASGTSRRRGIEADAQVRLGAHARAVANYSFLDAEERQVSGGLAVREVRRPRHSAAFAGEAEFGRLAAGASLAWVGKRSDTDFDAFPARTVILDDYLLASLQLSWRLTRRLEVYGRVENALGADYEDVFGYNTPGRTVHAGLRFRLRRP